MSEPGSTNFICGQCGASMLEDAKFCGMCGAAVLRSSERDPYVGEVVAGRYQIEKRIASGGMGEVYIAKHETLDQLVAVKLLHRRFASDERVVARFFNEARTYCRVKHPNAVGLLDFGRLNDGTLYIVTEFVDGVSLSQLVATNGPLSTALVVRLGRQLTEVLAALHQEQIVHRDLKPDNVMVTDGPGGRSTIKVLDFGIAKVLDEGETRLTRTGSVFGTPEYMSPEQAQGQSVDQRSDLYSLGALLFFALTGAAPFEAEERRQLLQRHISDPPPLNKLRARSDVPLALVDLIAALLEKRPDKRPADMLAVLGRLEGLASTLPEPALQTLSLTGRTAPRASARTLPARPSAKLAAVPAPSPAARPTTPNATGPTAARNQARTIEDLGARDAAKTVEDPAPGPTRPVDLPAVRPQSDAFGLSGPGSEVPATGPSLAATLGAELSLSAETAPAFSNELDGSFDFRLGARRSETSDDDYTWGDEEEPQTDDPFKRSLDLDAGEVPAHSLGHHSPMPWIMGALVLVAAGFGLYFLFWGGGGDGPAGALAGVETADLRENGALVPEGTGAAALDAGVPVDEVDASRVGEDVDATTRALTPTPTPTPTAATGVALIPTSTPTPVPTPTPAPVASVPRAARDVIAAGREAGHAATLLQAGEVDEAAAAWARAHALLSGAGFGEAVPQVAARIARAQELVSETRAALERTECGQADRRIVEMRELSPALRRAFLSELYECNRRRDRQQGRPPRTLE